MSGTCFATSSSSSGRPSRDYSPSFLCLLATFSGSPPPLSSTEFYLFPPLSSSPFLLFPKSPSPFIVSFLSPLFTFLSPHSLSPTLLFPSESLSSLSLLCHSLLQSRYQWTCNKGLEQMVWKRNNYRKKYIAYLFCIFPKTSKENQSLFNKIEVERPCYDQTHPKAETR